MSNTMFRGFDISENNAAPDLGVVPEALFAAAENAGCKFVYVRASWGNGHLDSCFRDSVEKAHAHGLLVGAYHYDYGLTPLDAAEQAKKCADLIDDAGVLLELPVFYDMEDADGWKRRHGFDDSRENVTDMCRAWLQNIGLNSGIYASYSWLEGLIDWPSLYCPVWNAEWGDTDDLGGYVWQDKGDDDPLRLDIYNVDGDWMYDASLFES